MIKRIPNTVLVWRLVNLTWILLMFREGLQKKTKSKEFSYSINVQAQWFFYLHFNSEAKTLFMVRAPLGCLEDREGWYVCHGAGCRVTVQSTDRTHMPSLLLNKARYCGCDRTHTLHITPTTQLTLQTPLSRYKPIRSLSPIPIWNVLGDLLQPCSVFPTPACKLAYYTYGNNDPWLCYDIDKGRPR